MNEAFPDSQAHNNPPTHLQAGSSLPPLGPVIYVHALSLWAGSFSLHLSASPQMHSLLSIPCSMLLDADP